MRPAPARAGSDFTYVNSVIGHRCFNEAGPREGRKHIYANVRIDLEK